MHKKATFFLVLLFITLLSPCAKVFAHAGGGPPFLKVNGEYAQTNPFYITQPKFNIPLDITDKKFLADQEINFEIDTDALGVPMDIINKSTFRWQFEDKGQYAYGLKAMHIYKKIGSYIPTIEGQGPGDPGFTVLDSVQVNVVPDQNYTLPKVFIRVNKEKAKSGDSIAFTADAQSDPNAPLKAYEWDLGDDSVNNQKSVTRSFDDSNNYQPIFVKVTDKNGLFAHSAVGAGVANGVLQISSVVPQNLTAYSPGPVAKAGKAINQVIPKPANTQASFFYWGIVGAVVLTVALVIWFVVKTVRGKQN